MVIDTDAERELRSIPARIRPGRPSDSASAYAVHRHAIAALNEKLGITEQPLPLADEEIERGWREDRALYAHLAAVAEQFWVAERGEELLGYARAVVLGGVRELTELFVAPGAQAAGIGRQLLEAAFPRQRAWRRCVIATIDPSAQALYLRAGVYPRFPLYSFSRAPEMVAVPGDLRSVRAPATPETVAAMGFLDEMVLEHRRDVNHAWLLQDRQAYFYYRGDALLGYGYVGAHSGPFALLSPDEYPAVLAHAEAVAAQQGHARLSLIVPLVNEAAVGYLLRRQFRMGRFFCQVMTDRPFGRFEQYIATAPMFFL
ncbi:MAG: GNAT family N-acetyltransferase [Chloroflexi bacterium OHK40]